MINSSYKSLRENVQQLINQLAGVPYDIKLLIEITDKVLFKLYPPRYGYRFTVNKVILSKDLNNLIYTDPPGERIGLALNGHLVWQDFILDQDQFTINFVNDFLLTVMCTAEDQYRIKEYDKSRIRWTNSSGKY